MKITISGKVIHGDHYGRNLGFPTANIDRRQFVRKRMKIKLGIWAGWAVIPFRPKRSGAEKSIINRSLDFARDEKVYTAAIVIGPLDKKGLPKIEAHLIGFKGNLYGKKVTISLKKYLRPFRKYKNVEKLKAQIANDIRIIRKSV